MEWSRLERQARPWAPRSRGVSITQCSSIWTEKPVSWAHPIHGLKLLETCPGYSFAYANHLKSKYFQ